MCYVALCGIQTQSKTRSIPAGQRIYNRRRAPPPPMVGFAPLFEVLIGGVHELHRVAHAYAAWDDEMVTK